MFDLREIERLAGEPREIRQVDTPAGPAFLRALSARERDEWEAWFYANGGRNSRLFRASLVAACLVDEKRVPVYEVDYAAAAYLGHLQALSGVPVKILDPVYAVAAQLAGVTAEDEETLGNGPAGGRSGGESSSGSLSPSDTGTPTSCSAS